VAGCGPISTLRAQLVVLPDYLVDGDSSPHTVAEAAAWLLTAPDGSTLTPAAGGID
jgi:hypothetical protein